MKTDLILQRSTFFSTNSSSTIFNQLSTGSISLVRKTIFLVCIGLLGFNSWGQIAGDYRSGQSGSWTTSATWQRWSGSQWLTATSAPSNATTANSLTITILSGHTITTGASGSVLPVPYANVIIASGGTLTVQREVELYGTFSNSGTINLSGTTGSGNNESKARLIQKNTANFSNSGAINGVDNDNRLEIRGDFSNTGTITVTENAELRLSGLSNQSIQGVSILGDLEMKKNGGVATITGDFSGNELLINEDNGALNLGSGTHTFSGKVEFDKGTLQGGSATLNANGSGTNTWTRNNNNTTSFVAGTGTVVFGSSGNQTIASQADITTFNNVTFAGSGVKTIPAEITVNGNLTLTGTASTALAANETIGGNVTIGSGTTLSCASSNRVLTLNGNFENNGTFTAGTGAHTFTGANKTISGSTATTIPSLVISGSYTSSMNLTVSTALSGSGSLTNTGTLNASGANAGSVSITTLSNSGTLNRSGAGTTTTALANFTNIGTINITGSGIITGITNNAGGIVNHSGSSTITSFNNATSTSTLNISRTPTAPTFTTLTTTVAGNTVNYTGAGTQTVRVNTYSNLGLSGSGAKTLQTGTTINGDLSISGSANTSLVEDETIGGNVTIGTGTTLARSTFSLTTLGNFINNGTLSGSGAVNFTGGAAIQTISGTGALNFSNVTINKSAGEVRLNNNISISGALNFEALNIGTINLNGKTLTYSGTSIQSNGGGILGSVSSSKLKITNTNQITSALFPQSEIYDLEISGVNTNVTSDAEFTITNELIVGSQSTLTLSNGWAVTMLGNITNNGTINGLGTSSVLIFNKEGSQTVTGAALSVGSITINKLSGNLILNAPLQVKGTLTMTKGNIITTSTNLLTVGSSSSAPGSINYSGGTITGPLRRYFANSTGTDYYFPIGNTTSTRGVTINMAQSPGSNEYITAQYKAGTPVSVSGATLYDGLPLTTADGQLIQNYDEEGYWQIDPKQYNSGIDMANYTISLQMNNISGVNDYTKTRIIKADGPSHVAWSALTHLGATGSNTNFTLTASGNGFSWFNGGGDNNNNPLPVELLSFNGTCKEGMVNLLWQTASEFNSSHFDVEKSTDGETWRVLATIPSAGTSNELLTYQTIDNNGTSGSNYYRLRQVDIDGKEKLYDPINVSCAETTAGYFTSYPNPSGNEFQVVVNNKEILGACTLNIVDVHGKVIDQRSIDMKDGINMFVINETLNPGIYFLNITNGIKSTQVIKHAVK